MSQETAVDYSNFSSYMNYIESISNFTNWSFNSSMPDHCLLNHGTVFSVSLVTLAN